MCMLAQFLLFRLPCRWQPINYIKRVVRVAMAVMGKTVEMVVMALMALRNKCLVHKRDSDGAWERTVQE